MAVPHYQIKTNGLKKDLELIDEKGQTLFTIHNISHANIGDLVDRVRTAAQTPFVVGADYVIKTGFGAKYTTEWQKAIDDAVEATSNMYLDIIKKINNKNSAE